MSVTVLNWVWRFPATLLRVIDADSHEYMIDQGLRGRRQETVRLMARKGGGIDAWELRAKEPTERALAAAGRARVMELLPVGSVVVLRTYKPDSLAGRWLSEVELPDGRDLGDLLVAEGLAKAWTPGKGT